MLRIFTTQLTGLTKEFLQKQEEQLEDAARLLAQAAISGGTIYIAAYGEMKAIQAEALHGKEPLIQAAAFTDEACKQLSDRDRIILATRSSDDPEAVALAKSLHQKGIPFLSITTLTGNADDSLVSFSDIILNLGIQHSLVPTDNGSRIGYPASLLGLYAYFYLSLTLKDMLMELE
ncbi:DUF2529 family protein [Alkalicoccobacillus porphyridii]|nr:DUF2529 family protein [Alkalicoccobacillus porphyridii]